MDLRTAIKPFRPHLSGMADVFADGAISAESMLDGSPIDPIEIAGVAVRAITAAVSALTGIADAAGSLGDAIPIVGAFISAVLDARNAILAEQKRREEGFVGACTEVPYLRTGRYPSDLFVRDENGIRGWMGLLFEAFEEDDYEPENGGVLATTIRIHTHGAENPHNLSREARLGLATMRTAITDDLYSGGLYLFPIYLDACLHARKALGASMWRALAIKRAQRQPFEPRGRERDWAITYARGGGSLYMSDTAAAAEYFPPCDYTTGLRIGRAVKYLDAWEDRAWPRFPIDQERAVKDAAGLRLALAGAYRHLQVELSAKGHVAHRNLQVQPATKAKAPPRRLGKLTV